MALLKKSFKVYGKQDIQTKYLAFDGTNKKSVDPDKKKSDGSLLENYPLGKINPQKKCIPAGSLVKFDGTSHKLVSATSSDTVNNTSVFLLAEDLYVPTYDSSGNVVDPGDPGFVYWVVEDVNNLVEA